MAEEKKEKRLNFLALTTPIFASSVAAMSKKKPLWIVNIVAGPSGMGSCANGFFLVLP
ncbi:MAG: hypothetical protein OHK006_23940 [Thermodesulfovibrionales bacterium]